MSGEGTWGPGVFSGTFRAVVGNEGGGSWWRFCFPSSGSFVAPALQSAVRFCEVTPSPLRDAAGDQSQGWEVWLRWCAGGSGLSGCKLRA